MQQPGGLRERKKRQTARAIGAAAIRLFTEHTYDGVSIEQIAAAANVSKMTVFNYFPTKENLLRGPLQWPSDGPARAVRERPAGVGSLTALRRHVLAAIAERDVMVGMSDDPQALAVCRLVLGTPALSHLVSLVDRPAEEALTAALAEDLPEPVNRIVAGQFTGTLRALRHENLRRLLAGEPPDAVEHDAVTHTHLGFDILEHGLTAR
ncbi:TetR/AcrR family transcriptional regulator [Streptomyces sp. CA2R101]|uniref:TetR/AcrR family transcriptional regulator n=1 Tax=Streptomyces sp. CA2R101 TaxID=3120152 RepID=UPI0030087008